MGKVIVCGVLPVMVFAATAWGGVGGGEVTFLLAEAANVTFSHDAHVVKHKQKCGECHYRIYTTTSQRKDVTMAQMQKGQSCGACHNGQQAFDVKANCKRCHE